MSVESLINLVIEENGLERASELCTEYFNNLDMGEVIDMLTAYIGNNKDKYTLLENCITRDLANRYNRNDLYQLLDSVMAS